MSLNRVQLIGNLTRDPEMRQIPGGSTVANFAIATNFTWTDKNGQKQEKVEFHNIVVWGKLAEICSQYLKKGSKAFIEGRLQTREWEGEDGVKRYKTEIIAENMIMLDKKGSTGGSEYGYSNQSEHGGLKRAQENSESSMVSQKAQSEEVTLDDLPF